MQAMTPVAQNVQFTMERNSFGSSTFSRLRLDRPG
jgi:hypothetical protein